MYNSNNTNILLTNDNSSSANFVKKEVLKFYEGLPTFLHMKPIDILINIDRLGDCVLNVRDDIFFECFTIFILNFNDFDQKENKFINNNLEKLAIAIADISPNSESEYVGDEKKLREYSKRILKVIDECTTIQKAFYIANISRAFIHKNIDRRTYFKLAHCITSLTDEDLLFLRDNISEKIIHDNDEYVDDFRGLGLMYEVEGGFAYSQRAFLLLNNALRYEESLYTPDSFPKRAIISDNEKGPFWNKFE